MFPLSILVGGRVCPSFLHLWRCVAGALCFVLSTFSLALGQSETRVHGHVYHTDFLTPCASAAVQAWPCGTTVFVDDAGYFEVACGDEIDSLSVISHGHQVTVVQVNGRAHVDVELLPLIVSLSQAEVAGFSVDKEPEGIQARSTGDVLATLESVSGLRGLDLGAGLIQPVFRGLVGSRVAVLENGVPQVGGRWGADHGVLVDPVLYDGVEAVPGGGHVWLGPEAMGGAVRLSSIGVLPRNGSRTQTGSRYRFGDQASRIHVLHRSRQGGMQWHAGGTWSQHGNRNVAQSSFQYIGRQFVLSAPRLPNTSGQGVHGVAGMQWVGEEGHSGSIELRLARVRQGLFPGIIGVPDQSDLELDDNTRAWELPLQDAQRMQLHGKWCHEGRHLRTVRLSLSRHTRSEYAPPHAHGFGPEPDNDLSLSLGENHLFAESKWERQKSAFGIQVEALDGQTLGWEFLLPNHSRHRVSWIGERQQGQGRIGFRFDVIRAEHDAHSEPLYNAEGNQVGLDTRTRVFRRVFPGGALSWHHPLALHPHLRGSWTLALHSRAPSSYALAANGIHHGTFRFEQGNPELLPEQTAELRWQLTKLGKATTFRSSWGLRGFSALHKGFIHLTPRAEFAPIAHAGQIYAFQAKDAFRVGLEGEWTVECNQWVFRNSLALLGQWALETGLGLPFTSPADLRSVLERQFGGHGRLGLKHRWLAEARITARNEAATPGASLWGIQLSWDWPRCAVELEVDNVMNAAWLDHVSAYRALGLVAQGRWASIRFTMDVKGGDAAQHQD